MQQPTVQAMWQKFREQVLPQGASQTQVEDTQAAFYAGAAAMLGALGEITDCAADEEEACRLMATVDRELKKFMVTLMARAMAQTIAQATGAQVHAEVHDVTVPPAGEVH